MVFSSVDDIEGSLCYLCPYKDYLTPYEHDNALISEIKSHASDYDYWKNLGEEAILQKGFVHFDEAERSVCSAMLDSLNKYFQVDYTVDAIYGATKQDNLGLCADVRKKIIERF